MGNLSLLSFIYLSIYLYQYGFTDMYFIFGVISQCYVIYLLFILSQLWPLGANSGWLWYAFYILVF